MRLTDFRSLQLPEMKEREITQIAYENRMHWEVWMESAESYQELRENLAKRGYTNLPLSSGPSIQSDLSKLEIDQNRINNQAGQKTMMKRASGF